MKKVLYIAAVLLVLGAIGFTLANNKKEMAQAAAVASQTSKAIPVVLTTPKTGAIDRSFSVNGTFAPIQSLSLMSETQGQVIKLNKRKGEAVKAGELLAQVENEVLRANVITAQANYEKAKKDLARFENLASGEAITQRQLEEVKLGYQNAEANLIMARQRLEKSRIVAPISGIINESYIEIGSFLNPGTKLFDIVNVDKLKLNAKVSEREVMLIRKGSQAKVRPNVLPDKQFEGTITAIGANADRSLKYDVEIQVDNTQETPLRAGMYGSAFFAVADTRQALLLEREAIATSLQNPKVFVVKEGKASLKDVTIGTVANNKVEITGGLTEGEQVVLSGQINLREGTAVAVMK
ncbi:efflux RND transporter periplasmic adaptor subunit [Cesiribacter andamanensis]|uniref:Macrolide-specific efflux protein macA n=1 Tax=Cesiribacter andamanensis AMV16 TaxID=1279009 RepID=M7NV36_9BACT|nr:efflux RND transporter periplasmic adaptor subunit [Cesiribacter andamanensis]EMR02314.1 Macrolide-specific efflux protein macA precursor [Cesiribacter andamanensis AMV16]